MKGGIAVAVAVLAGFSLSARAAEGPLTLEECLAKVMKTYPALKEARAEIEAQTQQVRQARSSFFPRVSASVGADLWRRSPGQPLEGVFPGTDLEPTTALSASWNILGHRTPLEYRQASIKRDQAGSALADIERTLESRTVSVYYDFLEAQEVHAHRLRLLALAEEEMGLEERLVEDGSSSPLRGIASELGLLDAQRGLADAKSALEQASAELSLLIGEEVEPDRKLEELERDGPADPGRVESWLKIARAKRPDLGVRRASVEVADKNAAIAFWERLPTVNVGAQYALNPDPFYGTGARPFHAKFLDTEATWTFGVGLDLPLFTGGDLRARHVYARIQRRQAEHRLSLAGREVERDVRSAHARFIAAREKLRIRARELELTASRAEVIERLYKSGVRYHRVDWQSSLTELARKEVDLVSARVEAREAWVNLLRAAGLPVTARSLEESNIQEEDGDS